MIYFYSTMGGSFLFLCFWRTWVAYIFLSFFLFAKDIVPYRSSRSNRLNIVLTISSSPVSSSCLCPILNLPCYSRRAIGGLFRFFHRLILTFWLKHPDLTDSHLSCTAFSSATPIIWQMQLIDSLFSEELRDFRRLSVVLLKNSCILVSARPRASNILPGGISYFSYIIISFEN